MRSKTCVMAACGLMLVLVRPGTAQRGTAETQAPAAQGTTTPADDPVRTLVGRLDLEKYKATIKGLTPQTTMDPEPRS
jgi:hypothetical protein